MNLNAYEIGILRGIQVLKCPFLDFFMLKITALANGGMVWIAAAAVLFCFQKTRKCAWMLAFGLILCLVLNNLTLKPLFARERPFVYEPSLQIILPKPGEYSFPSGHALSSFMAATVLFYCGRRRFHAAAVGVPIFGLAALISFSRLYLMVHYPTDVVFGAVLGALFGLLAIYAVNAAYKLYHKREKTKPWR